MATLEELLALEQRGADSMVAGTAAEFYADVLTEDAVLVVPGMILDRATFISSMNREPDMRELRIEDPRVVELGAGAAVLLYRAVASLPDGGGWTSFMNSTYVRTDGGWKLAYHQQTPTS